MNRDNCAFGRETGKQCTTTRAADCGSEEICDGKRTSFEDTMYHRICAARAKRELTADAFTVSAILGVALNLPKEQVLDRMQEIYRQY